MTKIKMTSFMNDLLTNGCFSIILKIIKLPNGRCWPGTTSEKETCGPTFSSKYRWRKKANESNERKVNKQKSLASF